MKEKKFSKGKIQIKDITAFSKMTSLYETRRPKRKSVNGDIQT